MYPSGGTTEIISSILGAYPNLKVFRGSSHSFSLADLCPATSGQTSSFKGVQSPASIPPLGHTDAGKFGGGHHKGRNEIGNKSNVEDLISRMEWEHLGLNKTMPTIEAWGTDHHREVEEQRWQV